MDLERCFLKQCVLAAFEFGVLSCLIFGSAIPLSEQRAVATFCRNPVAKLRLTRKRSTSYKNEARRLDV